LAHEKRHTHNYYLLTLGCPKNEVDSEGMAELLQSGQYQAVSEPVQADLLIVNTCGFLQAAKEESLEAIHQLSRRKRRHQLLIVAGCLAQRFGAQILDEVDGVDGIIGARSWTDIVSFIGELRREGRKEPLYHLPLSGLIPVENIPLQRLKEKGRASAYLKISDGCSATCAFCTIPSFKGPNSSRPRELILQEARNLAGNGIHELVVIAQDTTAYGLDWGEVDALPGLLADICRAAPEVDWLRLMYAFPGHASEWLIEVMASHPAVLPYIDIPLQHGHPETLRRMNRPHNVEKTLRWLELFRRSLPGAAIRTTLIVGYPGETEAEFQALLDFMAAAQFDRVGIFQFSPEPGTAAANLPEQIPDEIKAERWERAMAFQQPLSLKRNQALVGRRLQVLVDGTGDGLSVCRSYRDAPEVDGYVLLQEERIPGSMLEVLITGAMEYDLSAIPADKPLFEL
jgi:ribosomal protein S12 methylthiotransferase